MARHVAFAKPVIRRWIRDHADKGAYRSKPNRTLTGLWVVALLFAIAVLVMA